MTRASDVGFLRRVDSRRRLLKERAAVTAELEKVFGSGLNIKVEEGSGNSGQAAIIALGVLLAVCVVALVVLVTVYVVK